MNGVHSHFLVLVGEGYPRADPVHPHAAITTVQSYLGRLVPNVSPIAVMPAKHAYESAMESSSKARALLPTPPRAAGQAQAQDQDHVADEDAFFSLERRALLPVAPTPPTSRWAPVTRVPTVSQIRTDRSRWLTCSHDVLAFGTLDVGETRRVVLVLHNPTSNPVQWHWAQPGTPGGLWRDERSGDEDEDGRSGDQRTGLPAPLGANPLGCVVRPQPNGGMLNPGECVPVRVTLAAGPVVGHLSGTLGLVCTPQKSRAQREAEAQEAQRLALDAEYSVTDQYHASGVGHVRGNANLAAATTLVRDDLARSSPGATGSGGRRSTTNKTSTLIGTSTVGTTRETLRARPGVTGYVSEVPVERRAVDMSPQLLRLEVAGEVAWVGGEGREWVPVDGCWALATERAAKRGVRVGGGGGGGGGVQTPIPTPTPEDDDDFAVGMRAALAGVVEEVVEDVLGEASTWVRGLGGLEQGLVPEVTEVDATEWEAEAFAEYALEAAVFSLVQETVATRS